jgi:hypothetical protein
VAGVRLEVHAGDRLHLTEAHVQATDIDERLCARGIGHRLSVPAKRRGGVKFPQKCAEAA